MYCVNGEVRLFRQLHDIRSRNKEEVNEQYCTYNVAHPVSSLQRLQDEMSCVSFPLWSARELDIPTIHIHNSNEKC